MGEGPYRTQPKGDEEFDPEKHVKVDEKSWVRKTAVETAKKAEKEAERRNLVAEKPSWFARLFGKTNKETYLDILHEEAFESDLAGLEFNPIERNNTTGYYEETIRGTYNGHDIELRRTHNKMIGKIDNLSLAEDDAEKIWARLHNLIRQRSAKRSKLEQINKKLQTKLPVLEVLGTFIPRKQKELPETKEPKQLPEKTE